MFWSNINKWFFQESGSKEVEPTTSTNKIKIEEYGSIKDFINEVYLLPYLTIGGSRTEFWELTPKDIEIDFKAYKKRCEEKTQLAWLNGLYFKLALQSSVLVSTLADKSTKGKMPKYPDVPRSNEYIETEDRINAERELLIAKMNKWKRFNNLKKKK